MDLTSAKAAITRQDNLESIREAGHRLMSLSDLRYEGRYISAGEFQRIHVMEFGVGPPVILIHGAGSGGPAWHRQIAALAENHRVIVPDVPMFGLSEMPSRVHAPRFQISQMILGVMDQLDIEAADIAGHSMGALGTLGAMIQHPDRFNRAVLISSPGFGRGLNWLLRLATAPVLRWFVRYDSRRDRGFFFDRFEAQKSGPSGERELWKELHFQVGARNGASDTFHQGLHSFTGLRGQRDVLTDEELRNVKAKSLLVWGDSDLVIPTNHNARAGASIHGARLEIIPNCGHVVQLEAPDRLTELMVDWFRVS